MRGGFHVSSPMSHQAPSGRPARGRGALRRRPGRAGQLRPVPQNPPRHRLGCRTDGQQQLFLGHHLVIDQQQRLLVTNYHVVTNKRDVQVYSPTWADKRLTVDARVYWTKHRPAKGRVVFTDKARDLALIQLATMPKYTRQLPLAARPPQVGEAVHSIGNSSVGPAPDAGYLWRYTKGQVRLLRHLRDTFKSGQAVNCRVVETSSPTNNGDSGGPVVNDRGELVAVVSCCATKDRNISWFIEVSEVRTVLRAYYNHLQRRKGNL